MSNFAVVCASGSFRDRLAGHEGVTHFGHRWTDGGVDVAAGLTGAHVLHLAVAVCVLNDLYREAQDCGIPVDGVRVEAEGEFDEDWSSTGITYRVDVDSPADLARVEDLIALVDQIAEIPRAIRAGAAVTRTA
ncbi:OsmC family protein [Propionicimonas sp.]|uniref:OsmC family protein n=1 Tax=Propionicimonas sp. TaxID=1955623 RepID=UPI0039E68655